MKTALKAAMTTMAFSLLFTIPTKAHADGLCLPIVGCILGGSPSNPPTNDAPEISGSMLSTGFGLIAGVAMMVRGRRRSSSI